MTLAVVILAGGEGSRIGGEKPLRTLGGVSLLDRAAAQARRWSDRMCAAVRDPAQLGNAALPFIEDDPAIEGPLAGLVAALHYARGEGIDAVLTIPADMPFLPEDLGERLTAAVAEEPAAIASSGGHLHPVCGLWRTEALDRAPDYLASGRRSLKGLAQTVGYLSVDWPAEPIDPFFNINSPDDLVEAERLLRR